VRPLSPCHPHAGGHETEVDVLEHVLQGRPGHLGRALPDVGVTAGAKPLGQRLADQDALVGLDHVQVLLVRVDCDRLRPGDLEVVEAVDGVVARPAASDDHDPRLPVELVLVDEPFQEFAFDLGVLECLVDDGLH